VEEVSEVELGVSTPEPMPVWTSEGLRNFPMAFLILAQMSLNLKAPTRGTLRAGARVTKTWSLCFASWSISTTLLRHP